MPDTKMSFDAETHVNGGTGSDADDHLGMDTGG